MYKRGCCFRFRVPLFFSLNMTQIVLLESFHQVFPSRRISRERYSAPLWKLHCSGTDCQFAGWVAHSDRYEICTRCRVVWVCDLYSVRNIWICGKFDHTQEVDCYKVVILYMAKSLIITGLFYSEHNEAICWWNANRLCYNRFYSWNNCINYGFLLISFKGQGCCYTDSMSSVWYLLIELIIEWLLHYQNYCTLISEM